MRYIWLLVIFHSTLLLGQVNCNVYKLAGDENCYKACEIANRDNAQGSKASQEQFDEAILLCPTLDYAYFEKSVPYLKRGQFKDWRVLIDKAVELNPTVHLGYRGWCRYQFLRDYRGAISDLERLQSLIPSMGYSANGNYHLQVALALCYKAEGEREKAISLIEGLLKSTDYSALPLDFFHLGVLKYEVGDLTGALECLEKSIKLNDYVAENYFYLAKIYQAMGGEWKEYMAKAKNYYTKGYRISDPYTHPMDKIYLSDIEQALAETGR